MFNLFKKGNANNYDAQKETTFQAAASEVQQVTESPTRSTYLRTDEDEILITEFTVNNQDMIMYYENQIEHLSNEFDSIDPFSNLDTQINLLDSLISIFEEYREKCYETESGQMYFSDSWEHCFTVQCPDFSFIDPYKEKLVDIKRNYDKYLVYQNHYNTLNEDLLKIIREHPAIQQNNVYSYFNKDFKEVIKQKLNLFEECHLISRIKDGNSYLLYINK